MTSDHALRCTDGQGYLTDHGAEGWIVAPDGKRIGHQCREHAQAAIDEYRAKLGEVWSFMPYPKPDFPRPASFDTSHAAEQCPTCGRFVGDGWGEPGDDDYSPGFGDAAYHNPDGCDEFEGDVSGVVIFCGESCADRFHKRASR